jgi:cytochrome P450 family 110
MSLRLGQGSAHKTDGIGATGLRPGLPPGPGRNPLRQWAFLKRPRPEHIWMRRRYGDVVMIHGSDGPLVMAMTADGAREVLTADPSWYGPTQKRGLTNLTGYGALWVLEGERHRRERQLLTPAFHMQAIRDHGYFIRAAARRHTDVWQPGRELRIFDVMVALTRDTILRVLSGLEGGPLLDHGRRIMTDVLRTVCPTVAFIAELQTWWYPPWRKYARAKDAFGQFLLQCVAERRASGVEQHDVMGLLLAARYDGEPIPDDEIGAELGTLAFTGHVTTATALSWSIYELGRHPAVLARLREELDALDPDEAPEVVARQPYLSAVCNESQRLHTMLPEIGRMMLETRDLLGYTIRAGMSVGVGIGAIHHDRDIYPEPDRFHPERFLERTFSPYEFLPFGGSHRRCIGAALSDFEARVALAEIVRRWDFEIVGEDEEVRQSVITGPKYGVRARVVGRRR